MVDVDRIFISQSNSQLIEGLNTNYSQGHKFSD